MRRRWIVAAAVTLVVSACSSRNGRDDDAVVTGLSDTPPSEDVSARRLEAMGPELLGRPLSESDRQLLTGTCTASDDELVARWDRAMDEGPVSDHELVARAVMTALAFCSEARIDAAVEAINDAADDLDDAPNVLELLTKGLSAYVFDE